MRIRKQQRDRCMADFNCAGALHLLAAASVSNNVVHAAHEAAAVLQLQTSVSDVDAVEPMIIQDEKKNCSFGDSQVVKVEGEASSSVSDYGGSTKRIREEEQAGIKWIGVGLDSKKLQQKAGKTETSSNKLSPLTLFSSKINSDSSYLDIRSSCSVQQHQTLQISSCRSRSFPRTEPRNGDGNSSSEEKASTGRRSLEQKKGLNTNIQSTGRQIMDGEQEKIHDATHVLDTYTYSPDPFAQIDAEPDSKKLKVLKQAKIGHFFPQSSHHSVGVVDGRLSRKHRASPKTYGDKIFGVIPEQSSMLSPLGAAVQLPAPLSPDHPLNHSKESLLHAVYKVFLQAGKAGLTAREAASRVVEQGFPGHHQGGVMGRVEVGKLLRSSPFFMELEEGRFALFSAIIGGNEESLAKTGVEAEAQAQKTEVETAAQAQKTELEAEAQAQAPKKARQKGRWTGIPPLFKVEVEDVPMDIKAESEESCLETRVLQQGKSRRRLIQLTQEGDIELGDQCNRTDGKSWHCPLRARMGYQLCDYHLNKLRIKTTTSLPRKPNPAIVVKQQVSSGSTPDDSWLQISSIITAAGHPAAVLQC